MLTYDQKKRIITKTVSEALTSGCASEKQVSKFCANAFIELGRDFDSEESLKAKLRANSEDQAKEDQVRDLKRWFKRAGIEASDACNIRIVLDLEVTGRPHMKNGMGDGGAAGSIARSIKGLKLDGNGGTITKATWVDYHSDADGTVVDFRDGKQGTILKY